MTVIKVKIQNHFTTLYNGVLENPKLSFKAKGLWAYCMSRKDDWEFHVSHLATVSEDGRDAIYSALKELEREGLVEKVQERNGGKFKKIDYIIYPYPQEIQKILPLTAFPDTAKPDTANPPLLSTEEEISTERESSSSPPIPSSIDPCPSLYLERMKEMRKKDFSNFSQEDFDEAWDRYLKQPPGIRSVKKYLEVVLQGIVADRLKGKIADDLIESHERQACQKAVYTASYQIVACRDHVEFCSGSNVRQVPYNISDDEWKRQTGWNE